MVKFVKGLAAVAIVVAVSGAPAYAGGPTRMSVRGPGMAEPVVWAAGTEQFMVMHNVIFDAGIQRFDWAQREPLKEGPKDPGPRWVVVVDMHDVPTYAYEIYPKDAYIYIPHDQPRKNENKEGWYKTSPTRVAQAFKPFEKPAEKPALKATTSQVPQPKWWMLALIAVPIVPLLAMRLRRR